MTSPCLQLAYRKQLSRGNLDGRVGSFLSRLLFRRTKLYLWAHGRIDDDCSLGGCWSVVRDAASVAVHALHLRPQSDQLLTQTPHLPPEVPVLLDQPVLSADRRPELSELVLDCCPPMTVPWMLQINRDLVSRQRVLRTAALELRVR